jgi:hypothetical protein
LPWTRQRGPSYGDGASIAAVEPVNVGAIESLYIIYINLDPRALSSQLLGWGIRAGGGA